MTCMYCAQALRGFADAKVVNVNGLKNIACADRDACNKRAAARERARLAGQ